MITQFCIISLAITTALSAEAQIIKQWNLLNFHCPNNDFRYINGFRPNETVVTGMEVTANRIFIGMPRLYSGLPATLAYVPTYTSPTTNPGLHAYPDWSFHDVRRGANVSCNGLISVYRFKIDSCQRLWVLDSGYANSNERFERSCPPKIAIFDLRTDRLVRTVFIPSHVLRPSSLLTNIIIDESQGSCDFAFAYISDTDVPGLIVYDSQRDTAWRIVHPSMFPDPNFAESTINGESITLMDGIVGLAHSPNLGILYYQPLATTGTFSVPTAALRKGPLADFETLPVTLVGRKSSNGLALAVNRKDESLIFSPFTETSIRTWNPLNNNEALLANDREKLQFVCDMKWIENDESIWIMSSRFHKFFRKSINPRDINIRIMQITQSRQPATAMQESALYGRG